MKTATIAKRAMLVQPTISVWTARRYDRTASEEVAELHKADAVRAGRYNKCLINVKAPEYVAVQSIQGAARRWHEEHTSPWAQDGARILSIAMFQDYQRTMSAFRDQFYFAVEKLIAAYPRLVEEQKKVINGLYKESDYPKQSELRSRFGFHISIFPVPVANDFRVELDTDDVEMLRSQIETEVEFTVKKAERDRWERLMRVVGHAVNRLNIEREVEVKQKGKVVKMTKSAIFRDSMIDNIKKAVDVLPKLALNDDPAFDAVLLEVKDRLSGLDPEELRENDSKRRVAARDAAAIMKKMAAYMPSAQ